MDTTERNTNNPNSLSRRCRVGSGRATHWLVGGTLVPARAACGAGDTGSNTRRRSSNVYAVADNTLVTCKKCAAKLAEDAARP